MKKKKIKTFGEVKVGDTIYVPIVWDVIVGGVCSLCPTFDDVTHITKSIVTDIQKINSRRYIISNHISTILPDPDASYHRDEYHEACTTEEEAREMCHKKLMKKIFDFSKNIHEMQIALTKYMSGLKNYYEIYEYGNNK